MLSSECRKSSTTKKANIMNYFNNLYNIFQMKLILNGYKTKCVTFLAKKNLPATLIHDIFFLENIF